MREHCKDAFTEGVSREQRGCNGRVGRAAPTAEAQPQVCKKFAACDDVILLQVVNAFRPWQAPAGTAHGIMKVFDEIAVHCAKHKGFGVQKNGPALRTRFTTLVNQFRADKCKSLRRSGTSEALEERESLLQQIVSQMDDWKERLEVGTKEKSTNAIALEKSGAVLKRLAMDNLDDEDGDPDSTTEASSSTPTQTKATPGRRRSKALKTEQLGAVTDASAMMSTGDDGKHSLSFEHLKMTFRREEAERQRQYLREEAVLRREHELAVEELRIRANLERERMLYDFVLKLSSHNKAAEKD